MVRKAASCHEFTSPWLQQTVDDADISSILLQPIDRKKRIDEMSARLVAAFAMMGAARAVVSTIGQVSQVSFEAYNQMGEALDADSRDVTMTNDGDCCMPHWARTPDNRPSIDAFLPGLDSCLHL